MVGGDEGECNVGSRLHLPPLVPGLRASPHPCPQSWGQGPRITTAGSLVGAVNPATFSNTWGHADSPGNGLSAASLRRLHSKRAGTAWWEGEGLCPVGMGVMSQSQVGRQPENRV